MKTRWESLVFILLMLLPAVCLLNTGTRPVAPATGNTGSQPCVSGTTSETSSQTTTGGSEDANQGMPQHAVNAAGVSSSRSIQRATTGKISK
jgi:hypothetical protein